MRSRIFVVFFSAEFHERQQMANLDRYRFLFRAIVQSESESFEAFYEKLKVQVIKCKYEDPDEQLFSKILQTCKHKSIVDKAFESDLTLIQLVAMVKSVESNTLTSSSSGKDSRKTNCCSRCGSYDLNHSLENCIAFTSKILCDKCERRGHYEHMCHSSTKINFQGNFEDETTNFVY